MFIVCGLSRDAPCQGCNVSTHKTRAVKSSAIENYIAPLRGAKLSALCSINFAPLTGCEAVAHLRSVTMEPNWCGAEINFA